VPGRGVALTRISQADDQDAIALLLALATLSPAAAKDRQG
jgi:hypothetical protein